MNETFIELQRRFAEIHALRAVNYLLMWDQHTQMPPGGAAARGQQMAVVARTEHEKITDPQIGRLLEQLDSSNSAPDDESTEALFIRLARQQFEYAIKVPPEFMEKLQSQASKTFEVWLEAREADNFEVVKADFERILELSRDYSGYFPDAEHPLDPLLKRPIANEGLTAAEIKVLFAELRKQLVPMVETLRQQPELDDSCLHRSYDPEEQIAFGLEAAQAIRFDLQRGRQDLAPHPFCLSFSPGDVRITTRIEENNFWEAFSGTIHETGHALYEQGIDPQLEGNILATGISSGVHESQSRLWENLVGRSRPFWRHYFPLLKDRFPLSLGSIDFDDFLLAINKVQPSLIRVDADEVTYNLHVMIRFDLELELLEGRLEVADIPERWNERYEADLGIKPASDHDGILQDPHWYAETVGGMFQGYTLGNIMSVQFMNAAMREYPEIQQDMEGGNFDSLHQWLVDNVYSHGSKFKPNELLERSTGGPLTIEPYLTYLKEKYGDLYNVEL